MSSRAISDGMKSRVDALSKTLSGTQIDPKTGKPISERISSYVNRDAAIEHLRTDYLFKKTVGKGGFCEVKLATHIPTGEDVAIKIFDKKMLMREDGEESVKKLLEENEILAMLDNDHITRLYEVIDTEDIMYIIMEYCSGGELFDYIIAHGHLEEYEACKILHQIMFAVEFCHSHGIVHRDLKPENLLLDKERDIKLIDFGLADHWSENGPRLEGLEHGGSPSYLPPEVIVDDEEIMIGPPVDVWALGVILYALISGALPFSGETVYDEEGNPEEDLNSLFEGIVKGKFKMPSFVSQEGQDLLRGMLNTDPSERFTLEKIRQTKWYQRFHDPVNEVGSRERVDDEVRPDLIDELGHFGYDRNQIIEDLQRKRRNALTAHYHLLAKKRKRENEKFDSIRSQGVGAQHQIGPFSLAEVCSGVGGIAGTSTVPVQYQSPAAVASLVETQFMKIPEPVSVPFIPSAGIITRNDPEAVNLPPVGNPGSPVSKEKKDAMAKAALAVGIDPRLVEAHMETYEKRHVASHVQNKRGSIHAARVDDAQLAMEDISRKLDEMGILWAKTESLCYSCSNDSKSIEFEVRIQKSPHQVNGEHENTLRLKRLKGEAWEFKEIGRQILQNCSGTLKAHHITRQKTVSLGA